MAKEVSIWRQVLEYAWAPVAALLGIVWKSINRELKFRREGEISLHKKLDEHIKMDADNFKELLTRVDDNHKEILGHLLKMNK